MNEEELRKLREKIAGQIANDPECAGKSDAEIESRIWETLSAQPASSGLSFRERLEFAEEIYSNMRGYGILDPLLADESITEIMVNGTGAVFCERNGRSEKLGCRFDSEKKLSELIQKIVGSAGREVNTATPIVDTRLPDGSRVSAVLPPVSLSGPILTIRRFPKEPMSFRKLIALGSVTEEAADALRVLVAAGYNIFISGGTGSGKTSFLNALSDFIPPEERIVTIEDSAELKITGTENLVSLETRNANSSGTGHISVRDLIRASLRMRPERIIVGEVRGAEALDMLQAMNTGHDGSISTGHANSTEDMLSRLETMVLEGAASFPLAAVRRQIASALDITVHLSRMRDKTRKVVEISEIAGLENGEIRLNPLFVFREEPTDSDRVEGKLVRTDRPLLHRDKLERKGLGKLFA